MTFQRYYGRFTSLMKHLEKVITRADSREKQYTNRKLLAAVLHGPRNVKVECVPEEVVRPDQVRVEVRYCAITSTDVLLWSGEHYRVPEPPTVLGFEVTGTILEIGGLAHEKTGFQRGEEVVVHNYPACGGFAETCLANYVDAAALTEDYFSPTLALGRRTRIQRGEYFIVNMSHSRAALAAVDLALHVFHAKPIVFCCDSVREELCAKLGVDVILKKSVNDVRKEIEKITGQREVRVIIDTEGGLYIGNILPCLQCEGIVVLISLARNRRRQNSYITIDNITLLNVSAGPYKSADPLTYRETVEQILDFRSRCTICPCISAIFGLYHIHTAFKYYMDGPRPGKVLIDMKNHDRCSLY